MAASFFGGVRGVLRYPCPTNEPAELAGDGGGSVDPSRGKAARLLWFSGPVISLRGSCEAAVQL